MNVSTERHGLTQRFNEMKAEGLTDMKFFLGETSVATVEQVCGDVNRILDLVRAGKGQVVESWGDKPTPC